MSTDNSENVTVVDVPPVRRVRGPGKKEIKLTQQQGYSAEYWMAKRSVRVHCDNCARLVCKGKMYRHLQTPLCFRHSKDPDEVEQIKQGYAAELLQRYHAEH